MAKKVITFGEVMMRLSPPGYLKFSQATSFELAYGGGEVNIAISLVFGNQNSPRVLYVLHHEDDEFPDNYLSRPYMTVLGFGRQNKEKTTKHLNTVQTFSIGFVESNEYSKIDQAVRQVLD